jgi:hypothetical protein
VIGTGAGGIRLEGSVAMTVRNSIVANNTGGTVAASLGYNLLGNLIPSIGPGDHIVNDVKLGPLQDNGGPTQTHALLPGSPAIDQGASSGSSTDQRGFPRPLDDLAIANVMGGDGADIGAFELSRPPPPPTATPTHTPIPPSNTPTFTSVPGAPTLIPTQTSVATASSTVPPGATATETPSVTTPTATATSFGPTPTATPTLGSPACIGDCNGDGAVSVNELVIGVGIALEQRPVGDCLAIDKDGNQAADITELVVGVNNALNDCPMSQP